MSVRKFPQPGTPLFDIVKARVEKGEDYLVIASDLDMTRKGFEDALSNHGIKRKETNYEGILPPQYVEQKSESFKEHIRIIKDMDKLLAYHHRTPTELTITIDTDLPIGLVETADWHLGMFGVDYMSFEKDVGLMASEPGLKCLIGGDGYHNIIQPSKMGSGHDQTPISVQKGLYVLALKELIDKILAIRTGNHNYWTTLAEGEDWDGELARRLKLVYLKHYARIYLKVGKMVYPILAMHKSRYNSVFNLTHNCKQNQRLHFPDARIVIAEHTHVAAMEEYQYNGKECIAIRPGTYAVYDDYAQQNCYFGSHVCNPTVILYPNEDRLVGFKDMHEAVVYLRAVRGGK